jgi:hypothetical protein
VIISRNRILQVLPAALVLMGAAICTCVSASLANAQHSLPQNNSKTNARPEQPNPPAPIPETKPRAEDTTYSYEFNQPEFYVRHVLITHGADGHGHVTFERLNEGESVEETLELSPAALTRILGLYQSLRFLDSDTNYQADKQFPHLGTVRIKMEQGARKRAVEFNWTNNKDAESLVNEYRRITEQAIFVFDMSVARQNQPLNAPKLLQGLETLLKRDGVSDPRQLVPLLTEISTDEHLPLIARNHAIRILKKIETGK